MRYEPILSPQDEWTYCVLQIQTNNKKQKDEIPISCFTIQFHGTYKKINEYTFGSFDNEKS